MNFVQILRVMWKLSVCSVGGLFIFLSSYAQINVNTIDDSTYRYLPDINVVGKNSKRDIQLLPDIVGTSIYAGKKTSLILLDNVKGNVVMNTMRQVMAKVPGIHVWESDGSGIQIGIAARGLSPNRSWEFNIRQNGYDISADPYGYPEAYYNPPLQAVQRIEVVRGQGSLQYGPQFGGMINYILRNGSDIEDPIKVEAHQSIGSNGMFNTFTAVGGKKKKFHYYTFFDHRNAQGYRQNSRYYTNTAFSAVTYLPNPKLSLTAEVMRSHIRSQQPGGLTDAQLSQDVKQSYRSRNWFDVTWLTSALMAKYSINNNSRIDVKLFNVLGNRNSVGYMPVGGIPTADSINPITGQYNPRNLNTDKYRNVGAEAKYLVNYTLFGLSNSLLIGGRLYYGNTFRYAADEKGSVGSTYDMFLGGGVWTKDIDFASGNAALFAEHIVRLGSRFSIIPGVRVEYIKGSARGRNGFKDNSEILLQDLSKQRKFLLGGLGLSYRMKFNTELYANISQAYRPVQFADLTAPPTSDLIDQDLADAKGYNVDLGYRGKVHEILVFDLSGYILQYSNRIGVIVQQRQDGSFYNYRTNVGNSRSKGIEGMVEVNPSRFLFQKNTFDVSAFISYSYTDARYGSLKVITKNSNNELVEKNLRNKNVENAPMHILRTGLTVAYKKVSLTGQYSYVADSYSDANNTITPSVNGQAGLIPSYKVVDLTATCQISKKINVKLGVNNLFNAVYFTRRSSGYPGPGALPSDGRTFFMTGVVRF